MKIFKKNKLARSNKYVAPEIKKIELDNEISLTMASNPPYFPNEGQAMNVPVHFENDPFKRIYS